MQWKLFSFFTNFAIDFYFRWCCGIVRGISIRVNRFKCFIFYISCKGNTTFMFFLLAVWLVGNPDLYYPLEQVLSPSRQPNPKVRLWKTDLSNITKSGILTVNKHKFEGVYLVELRVKFNSVLNRAARKTCGRIFV